MSNKAEFKTIEKFLFRPDKNNFVIPNYQRGYKWSVPGKGKDKTAVQKLMDDLINADWNQQYFLQGITVTEDGEKIILIDGQQRTTTLYFLFWFLDKDIFKKINLEYDIRMESREFIKDLKEKSIDEINGKLKPDKNDAQDIYYFKKAIEQIKESLENQKVNSDRFEFIDFLRNRVTILYIAIDADKATKTFTMMNGSKATMLDEELVKAELLRQVSLPDLKEKQVSSSVEDNLNDLKETITRDWENNALRSRYAREWDKWLYWWNRKDVQEFFNVKKPVGLLLDYYLKTKDNKFSFDNFRKILFGSKDIKETEKIKESEKQEPDKTVEQKKVTKLVFKELRDLQKSFEDIFNDPVIYNYLGLALIDAGEDKLKIIDYFINNKKDKVKLREFCRYRLVGATYLEINENSTKLDEKATDVKDILNNNNYIYFDENDKQIAFKELLRLNVKEDIRLNRKFDFSIWGEKSLEHIFPKSKVYHKNEKGELVDGENMKLEEDKKKTINDGTWIDREKFESNGTEHCIGNLVLLYGPENSEFGAKTVEEKKNVYFNIEKELKSRHLLHTISVFAKNSWGIDEIQENKKNIIDNFNTDYKFAIENGDSK